MYYIINFIINCMGYSLRLRNFRKHCLQLIVVTQAQVVCLICTPEAQGLRVDISGRPQVTVLQLLCNTFMIKG